jgi:hypothetical protein
MYEPPVCIFRFAFPLNAEPRPGAKATLPAKAAATINSRREGWLWFGTCGTPCRDG